MNLKDLAGAIIHDLKNQLHSVLLEGEKAMLEIPEEYRDKLYPVFARSRRVHQDAMQLVTLYRLQERGNFPADDAWPSDTVKHAIECFKVHWPDVEVKIGIDSDCQGYYNDALMQMALTNLLNNSAQAGAKNIAVTAEEQGAGLQIRVSDDGPGYPEDILDGSGNCDSGNCDKEGSTGMGLYFTELMVAHHSTPAKPATLELQNSADGGAEAIITLP